ncbi:MAG TPA: MEDS domain-containing protein [Vicinamibacterales bacterium]|nr:MEDS domain-containing protein [Vicinamibacterales bacterium]
MTALPAPRSQQHFVQFYTDEHRLFRIVAGFVADGLVLGDPALVIATRPHVEGITAALAARLIDVERAGRAGDLVFMDAQVALDAIATSDGIDAERFTDIVGGRIERMLAGRPAAILRAYGELVDLLWKAGREETAVELEMLWNRLAQTRSFTLLCGYSMGQFYKQVERYRQIGDLHTRILEETEEVVPGDARTSRHRR